MARRAVKQGKLFFMYGICRFCQRNRFYRTDQYSPETNVFVATLRPSVFARWVFVLIHTCGLGRLHQRAHRDDVAATAILADWSQRIVVAACATGPLQLIQC